MQFTRGNLALKEHLEQGKRVFLFESVSKGWVKFICELEFYDYGYFETHDSDGKLRLAIKFLFKRKGAYVPVQPEDFKFESADLAEEEIPLYGSDILSETEVKALVNRRKGQDIYRKRIIHRWQYKCAVTGFDKLEVLTASHIVPWAKSNNFEKQDVNNGILLSPTFDALFDRHLISFEDSGKIILSDHIECQAYQRIGVTGLEKIQSLRDANHPYLERHRDAFQQKLGR